MENETVICCNTTCRERLGCAKFQRALDVNAGKIRFGYRETEKCEYEK